MSLRTWEYQKGLGGQSWQNAWRDWDEDDDAGKENWWEKPEEKADLRPRADHWWSDWRAEEAPWRQEEAQDATWKRGEAQQAKSDAKAYEAAPRRWGSSASPEGDSKVQRHVRLQPTSKACGASPAKPTSSFPSASARPSSAPHLRRAQAAAAAPGPQPPPPKRSRGRNRQRRRQPDRESEQTEDGESSRTAAEAEEEDEEKPVQAKPAPVMRGSVARGSAAAAARPSPCPTPARPPLVAARSSDGEALACGLGEFWWTPGSRLRWQDPLSDSAEDPGGAAAEAVDFYAALVVPGAAAPPRGGPGAAADVEGSHPEGLPLAFFFPGLGEKAKDAVLGRYKDWASVAAEPYVLVAAQRQAGRWWFIDDDSTWGWVSGSFRPEFLALVAAWMRDMAGRPGIDADRVGLFGFSSGAYAAAELLASGQGPPFSGVGLGGIHGHGQLNLAHIPSKRQDGVIEKFQSFLKRLSGHPGAGWIEATHGDTDQQSPWKDAAPIYAAIARTQASHGLSELSMRILTDKDHDTLAGGRLNKTKHDYIRASFLRREFFLALFGGQAPESLPMPEVDDAPSEDDGARADVSRLQPGSRVAGADAGAAMHAEEAASGEVPPTTLDVGQYTVSCEPDGWEDVAFDIFQEAGFVIIEDLLSQAQCDEVLCDCEEAAKAMTAPGRKGSRGPGRYSFGCQSSTGSMLHVPSFARHLLGSAGTALLPFLELIFEGGSDSGFLAYAAGGDFVLGNVASGQTLHSDIQVARAQNSKLPVPMLSVNFCVQELTNLNGAAIVRDVRVLHGGTPNWSSRTRFLPSVEFVSAGLRAGGRKDMFPANRSLPREIFDELGPEMQEVCADIVAPVGATVDATFWKC